MLFFRNEQGSVITEFALVIPIVILMAFGMMQVLVLVNARTVIQQAAFDAVRSAAVYPYDHSRAEEIVEEQTGVIPLTNEKAQVNIYSSGDEINVEIRAKVILLPLINQTVKIGGGTGDVELKATALAKIEPYLGQE